MNTKTKILSLLYFILTNISIYATNYYVKNNGDDNKDGLNPANAWATIAKVNATNFSPGDSILFEKGGVWREELIIKNSGTANKYIVYSSYGTGNKPQILGSARAENWTEVSPNIWQSASEVNAPRQRTGNSVTNHPASIFFTEKDGSVTWGNMENLYLNSEGAPKDICECTRDNGFTLMDKEYDWCWQDNHIYVYSPENPGNRYNFIEVPQRAAAMKMNSNAPQQYIEISGFEFLYALKYGFDGGWPMNQSVRGLRIQNCHIGYLGTKGAASAIGLQIWHSDMLVKNNTIHDCGRRNISYNVYSDVRSASLVFENVVFENNELYHGYHTTGFDINDDYTDEFRDFIFRNNYIWDRPEDDPENKPNDFTSMGLYLSPGNGSFNNFKIYNNVFRFIKQKHISAGVLNNSFISYNTFYGMNVRAGASGYRGMVTVSGQQTNLTISNNIFHGNVNNEYVLSAITLANNSHIGTTMNNNLYFQDYENQRMVTIDGTGQSYKMSQWDAYKTATGWDANSPAPSNPLFTNAPLDLTLLENSTARNAAYVMADVTTDIMSNARGTSPTIGAYEYGSQISDVEELSATYPIFVYPNPTNGKLFFKLNSNEKVRLLIYTTNAQLIRQEMIDNESIVDLTKGIYIIRMIGKNINISRKVIVE